MKKYYLICLLIALSLSARSQNEVIKFAFDADSSAMMLHTKELGTTQKSKDSLYTLSKNWFASTYKNASAVIQVDDKDNGHILGKGAHIFYTGLILQYTIEVFVKDNKYRIYIHDLLFDYGDYTVNFTNDYKDYLALMAKNPKKANQKYDLRIGESYRHLTGLQSSLDTYMENKKDKSVF